MPSFAGTQIQRRQYDPRRHGHAMTAGTTPTEPTQPFLPAPTWSKRSASAPTPSIRRWAAALPRCRCALARAATSSTARCSTPTTIPQFNTPGLFSKSVKAAEGLPEPQSVRRPPRRTDQEEQGVLLRPAGRSALRGEGGHCRYGSDRAGAAGDFPLSHVGIVPGAPAGETAMPFRPPPRWI